jgi:hypothetical protein
MKIMWLYATLCGLALLALGGNFYSKIAENNLNVGDTNIAAGVGGLAAPGIKSAADSVKKDPAYQACEKEEDKIESQCEKEGDIDAPVNGKVNDGKEKDNKKTIDADQQEAFLGSHLQTAAAAGAAGAAGKALQKKLHCDGKRKLAPKHGLTPYISNTGETKCRTEQDVAKEAGNPACANEGGSANVEDPRTCVGGLSAPFVADISREELESIRREKGIQCLLYMEPVRPPNPSIRAASPQYSASVILTQGAGGAAIKGGNAAAENSRTRFRFCKEDQGALQGGIQDHIQRVSYTGEPIATVRPAAAEQAVATVKPVVPEKPIALVKPSEAPIASVKPNSEAVAAVRPVTGRGVMREAFDPVARPGEVPVDRTPSFVARGESNPYTAPTAQAPAAPAAQVAPVQQPYQTGQQQQQPTGVQTGRAQRDTQSQQRDYSSAPRVAQTTSQRESWLSSWLSPKQESQAPQQAPVVINNNNAQPWFIAEMKRMEDARLKAELEKKQLADKLKREADEKQKAEKEKKLAKNTSATKQSKAQKDAEDETTEIDPQTTFLKALMDAPSLEEVAQQYEEEQQKEREAYAKEQTKTTTIAQRTTQAEPSAEVKETKLTIEQKLEQKSRTAQQTPRRVQPAYTDVVPFTQDTQNAEDKNNAPQKSSLVSMLDQEAIKKGIPAPRIQEIPLPEKIAFTRTSYTVVVPTIRQTIKTIMRAYEKGELSQLERDRHATQLVALSEQLAGSAYGADFDTTQVLNDAARATELTAFMIAEHADNKAISDSLYGVFATLTPLTKSEPVALTPPSGSLKEWSEQHFALIKYKIETAMEDTQSEKAKELYSKALSLVKSAELYKDSDQQYWNSSADIKEAVRTLSLATALDRASKEPAVLEDSQAQEQKSAAAKAKTREALLKDKGQEKGIWGSFLNMLGL